MQIAWTCVCQKHRVDDIDSLDPSALLVKAAHRCCLGSYEPEAVLSLFYSGDLKVHSILDKEVS